MPDVIVTCLPHGDGVRLFPQVRGFYLARALVRFAHLDAVFAPLPLAGVECRVPISAEYQAPPDYFETFLRPDLEKVRADRMYTLVASSFASDPDHFSRASCDWFAARGGVLVHLPAATFSPREHWIGIGVDQEVVGGLRGPRRPRVVFDFPRSAVEDAAASFDEGVLAAVRAELPEYVLAGTGPPDAPVRRHFDEWVPYGQTHAQYVRQAFAGALAFVPGLEETMGWPAAEAQATGACVVHARGRLPDYMVCEEADLP